MLTTRRLMRFKGLPSIVCFRCLLLLLAVAPSCGPQRAATNSARSPRLLTRTTNLSGRRTEDRHLRRLAARRAPDQSKAVTRAQISSNKIIHDYLMHCCHWPRVSCTSDKSVRSALDFTPLAALNLAAG